MEEESLGTVQWPDLNLPVFDLYWSNDPEVTTEDDPRARVRPASGGVWQRRRDDGTLVSYFAGLVELANEPGVDFDFRVRYELVDGKPAPAAVAVIARRDRVGHLRPGDFSKAGIAGAIVEAGRRLALATGDASTRNDLAAILPREERPDRERTSAQEVRAEVVEVLRHYRKLREANGGEVPYRYARRIAERVYQSGEGWAQQKVRKRLRTAAMMGRIEPANAPGSKRRG